VTHFSACHHARCYLRVEQFCWHDRASVLKRSEPHHSFALTKQEDGNKKMTTIELQGHGNPLLEVAMKGIVKQKAENANEVTAKVSHEVVGHGDPLFKSVLQHDSPPMNNPLHAEFKGQGDPLMDAFIVEWHEVAKDAKAKVNTNAYYEEMKHEGDPLLSEAMIHEIKVSGTKSPEDAYYV